MSQAEPVTILLVEDDPAHAEAVKCAFLDSGMKTKLEVAGSLLEYRRRVAAHPPHIAIMDLNLPDGHAIEALSSQPEDRPFPILLITGFGDERVAVEAMKAGAIDYVVKSSEAFAAMPRTVERALREWNLLQERKRAEDARSQAEENFRRYMDESPMGIHIVSPKGETLYANRAILDIYGFKDIEELRSTPVKNRYTPDSYAEFQIRRKKRMNGEDSPFKYEISIIRKTGEIRRLEVYRKEILWNGQKQFEAIYQDITERRKSEEKLLSTLDSLRKAIDGTIRVLSLAVEKRDPYTAGHQKRVADLARAIGQEMGLAKERLEGLGLAGIIHDVGKISIPAEILSKPGPLTENEYMLIQEHPQIGHDILSDIDFSYPIAKIVLQHHERMNGSGYPAGLKGDDILLEARILAVSDVVEAMASHRPFRPALGIDAALEEIDKSKGVLYDSDVAAACLKLFREKGFKFTS